MADGGALSFESARAEFKVCINNLKYGGDSSRIDVLFQKIAGRDPEKKAVLDQVFRDLVKVSVAKSADIERCKLLLECVIECVTHGMCSPTLPFILLSDVFDCITLQLCEELFSFVEEHVSTWTEPLFFASGKNLLLRMCNDLLRRLSTSLNTVFCGRIQLLLASLFPLNEKSGLNLMSQFNVENTTHYTKSPAMESVNTDGGSSEMDVEGKEAGELVSSSVPIDYNLYRKFWMLQEYFSNPTHCYTTQGWRTFSQYSKEVLNVFNSHKLEHVTWKKKAKELKELHNRGGSKDGSEMPRYFAKFLTNEKLLNLQLNDSNFRRTILAQFLIQFQYLVGNVKFKSSNQVLTEPQSTWVKETTLQVYQLLRETPPDGERFAKALEQILEREENWISWKNEGCPSFIKESADDESVPKATSRKRKRSLGEDVSTSWEGKKVELGSPELTRLWNLCPDNLEACKQENRVFLPSLEEFFAEAIDQADPEAMVEDEYKVVNQSNFGWRAIRLLSRKSQHFFQPCNNPFKTLPGYLESVIHQLSQELTAKSEDSVVENGSVDTAEQLT